MHIRPISSNDFYMLLDTQEEVSRIEDGEVTIVNTIDEEGRPSAILQIAGGGCYQTAH